jgi:protein SCO1/2
MHVVRLLGALAPLLIAACSPSAPAFKGTDLSGVGWGGDFELAAHGGARVKTSDFRGKVVVLFFGFSRCPDICPPTLAKLGQVMKRLEADVGRVQVLFVTVDPKTDTVAELAAFVPKFHPSFIGLTGTETEIGKVAQDYRVAYAATSQRAPTGIVIDHFGGLLVKDAQGKLRLLIRNDAPVEDIVHDLRLLVRETR